MKVTIGLPVYNAAPYIADAIRSIQAQTFADWECIVIDDGSQDQSLQIIRATADHRFTVVTDGQNLGLIARLNQIAAMASGTYLARMDSDDIMHPERLSKQVAFLEAHPDVDVVGSSAYLIDTRNQIYGVRDVPTTFGGSRLLQGSPFVHPSVMGKRQWFADHPYEPSAHRVEDYELWLRTFSTSTLANLDEPLLYYREAGLPYLHKYVLTSRGMRTYLRQYGPAHANRTKVYRALATSRLKQALFILIHRLKQGERLMQARARKLSAQEHLDAALNLSRATGAA